MPPTNIGEKAHEHRFKTDIKRHTVVYTRMKVYPITITFIASGLGLFLIQSVFLTVNTAWYNAVGNIASAALIGGLLTLLQHILMKEGEEERLRELFGISIAIQKSGLTNILTDSSEFHYHDIIVNSTQFHVIMNDGQRWVGNHSPALEERFNKKGTVTEFYFVNPDGPFCAPLAQKTDTTCDLLKLKIESTVDLLKRTYEKTSRSGSLKIYYLKNYPTQTLFYTEKTVIVTPYQTSSGRNVIPLYEYHFKEDVDSIGSYLFKDLDKVRKESLLIYGDNQIPNR